MTNSHSNKDSEKKWGLELAPSKDNYLASGPQNIEFLPMLDLNVFPQLVYPISVESKAVQEVAERCLVSGRPLALLPLRNAQADPHNLQLADFYSIGLTASLHKAWEKENGSLSVLAQGHGRVRLLNLEPASDGSVLPRVQVEKVTEIFAPSDELRPLVLEVKRLFSEVLKLSASLPFNPLQVGNALDDEPGLLADLIVAALPLKAELKCEFLQIIDIKARLLKLLEHLNKELEQLETGRAISARIKEKMDKTQKEFQLRAQLEAISAELGEGEGAGGENDQWADLKRRLAAKALPQEVRAIAEKELAKLMRSSQHSAEPIANYLELILDLPWQESTLDSSDLATAKGILDQEHHGLEKVKKRILEFLAVRQLTGGQRSPILCFVGPPGVGKSSLARSISSALGREFVRLSLGGVRDEAEIRGHRRTYVGALPGRLISALKKAKSHNPLILLDEVDKLSHHHFGNPAAALLEVLDPEQNNAFVDHYLEIPFDLSKALFIVTANVLEDIPLALRDRLEIVELGGYTVEEKLVMAQKHLWPQELSAHGLEAINLDEGLLRQIIERYTREAGVRELRRQLGSVARKCAVAKVEGQVDFSVLPPLAELLGSPRHLREERATEAQVGVVTGLAWTAVGGELLFIEAVAMPGKGQLLLTGHLGEVMRESAQAAISYVRSRAPQWGLAPEWFSENDIHLHLPQGAIPKDGPSAGVALATAIASLALGRPVRPEVAMTGEISLRGLVLPIGGLKEKLLAAKAAGLSTVLIPFKNEVDLADIPAELLSGLEIKAIKTLDEALAATLIAELNSNDEVESAIGVSAYPFEAEDVCCPWNGVPMGGISTPPAAPIPSVF